jgi:nucleoside-diphosphate kinase
MAIERTFSMIKPDATKRNLTGAITKVLEDNGLRVVASKRVWMSKREAEGFYAVHKERPFFGELVEGMTSGPTIVQVLEGEGAILKNREIMGATNPANADEGTIRKVRAVDRREFGSRFGRSGNRCRGNQVLVLRHRNRWLIQASHLPNALN